MSRPQQLADPGAAGAVRRTPACRCWTGAYRPRSGGSRGSAACSAGREPVGLVTISGASMPTRHGPSTYGASAVSDLLVGARRRDVQQAARRRRGRPGRCAGARPRRGRRRRSAWVQPALSGLRGTPGTVGRSGDASERASPARSSATRADRAACAARLARRERRACGAALRGRTQRVVQGDRGVDGEGVHDCLLVGTRGADRSARSHEVLRRHREESRCRGQIRRARNGA